MEFFKGSKSKIRKKLFFSGGGGGGGGGWGRVGAGGELELVNFVYKESQSKRK